MLAAATLKQLRSARTRISTRFTVGDTKSHSPSLTAASGTTPSAATARRVATRCASAIPSSSHSCWLALPTAQAMHQPAIRSKSFSRSASLSSFESRTPLTRESLGRTAAPTINGPAHAPRPTSSMPTTMSWPSSQSSRSTPRVGGRPRTVIDGDATAGPVAERRSRSRRPATTAHRLGRRRRASAARSGSTAASKPPDVCGSKHSASGPAAAVESRYPAR